MSSAVAITLTQDQLNLQAKARAFADQEIRPIAAERDRIEDPIETFPWEVWRKASRLGLRTLTMPPEYGGIGMDVLTFCVTLEELCVPDTGFGAAFTQVWRMQKLLLKTEYLRTHHLPKFLADDDYMVCVGFTEPNTGSDNLVPYDGADGGPRTTAVRQPNGDWIINGKKQFVFAAGLAKAVFVLARTDLTKGVAEGATLFFLEPTTPGFHFGHVHNKMGWRNIANAELVFEDVRVPDEARLGPVNGALPYFGAFGKSFLSTIATLAIATSRTAFELTLERMKNQARDGRPAVEHQAVAMRLADMWADIELARTMSWRAAWGSDHDPNHDLKLGMVAELAAAETVVRTCTSAMQLWGPDGSRTVHPIEKLFRDCFAIYHNDGTNDLNRLRIARLLAGGTSRGPIG